MSYYNYFVNIASVLVPFEANVLPTWELVYLFLLKIGRIVFVGEELSSNMSMHVSQCF